MEVENRSKTQVKTRDHMSLDITKHETLVSSIKAKMESIVSQCICRIQEKHLEGNEDKYFPKLVSIGPYHHGKQNLSGMEDHKWHYLNTLLSRRPNIDKMLDGCVKALKDLEYRARKCYSQQIDMDSDEFVKLMLVDGCFIIELFLKCSLKGRRRDDPFFNKREMVLHLRNDMVLLENQIPFFVIQQLFYLVPVPKECNQSLTELALLFFKRMIPGDLQVLQERFGKEYFNHLFDLIHQCYHPTYDATMKPIGESQKSMHSASKLQESGINLKKAFTQNLLDIKFVKGVLKIPPLEVHHDYIEILFRNFIAFEYCCHRSTKHIASYAFLIDNLIQSEKDVRLLRQIRILTNDPAKKDIVLGLFKKIRGEVDVEEFYYKGLIEQINKHEEQERTNWLGKIKNIFRRISL